MSVLYGGDSSGSAKLVRSNDKGGVVVALMTMALLGWLADPAAAAVRIEGQVKAGGGAVAGSTVIERIPMGIANGRYGATRAASRGQHRQLSADSRRCMKEVAN
jgi:hypothetical protein